MTLLDLHFKMNRCATFLEDSNHLTSHIFHIFILLDLVEEKYIVSAWLPITMH